MAISSPLPAAATSVEPLYAIGSDDDESAFVGTFAECRARFPHYDPDSGEPGPIWFGDLRLCVGHLIDPSLPDAHELCRVATGASEVTAGDVYGWLVDEAQYSPHLQCALAVIAYRQRTLTAEQFRYLMSVPA